MDQGQVETTLTACERALDAGGRVDLRALGFWRAVEAVKRQPDWIERYAERIAATDRAAFLRNVRPAFPLGLGVAALVAGAIVGVVLVVVSFSLPSVPAGIALLLGTGAILGTTHGLAHLVAGNMFGIRFTHWYMDIPRRPQPGFKIDYASYLRTDPQSRAWMHAAGAIVTKLVPFAAIPLALAAAAPWWTVALLVAVGGLQLLTDALFSVRHSDWKRFRREMRLARTVRP